MGEEPLFDDNHVVLARVMCIAENKDRFGNVEIKHIKGTLLKSIFVLL